MRELKAVITRAALMHDEEILQPMHLPAELVASALAEAELKMDPARVASAELRGIPALADVELSHIRRVLQICRGNRTLAAQHLGITRQTLARRIGASEE